ncbi:Copper amine oxidase N-terminal domain-containing protein [Alkaliphilus peptidifermentans DSM 18978]|uniref:Copper amine oxidase N-terminal domain-containing protein n=1 Tax=Alkaliphilus peptidifermentans DSM 18978 TaxID=1120976 RepID=A0A1G5KV73_9FIRM|nr:Copper amine oxidase N-terminal domain-containing protein [Alkaliphilus peptidifermentans DSM 18978]
MTARGGSEGAGIGGGTNGAGGTVSIRGINTRVTAMGTSGGRDIGSGDSSSDGGTLEVLEGASVDITNTNSQIKLSLRDFSTDPEGGADVLDPISLSVNIDGIFLDTPNGQILFKANGEEVGRAFIEGEGMNLYGTAGMEVDDLLGGNYTFLVEYVPGAGDRFFSSDQIEITNYAISKFSQAPLTFNIPETITYGNEPFDIQVSGGSGTGDISYEVTSGNAVTVDNVGRVTIVGAGEAEVTVTKTGDDYYNEASVSIVIEVNKAIPTVTFPTAITISYGQTLSDSEFRLGVGDGAFAWKEPDTIPIVHNQGYIVVFTPNDPVNYDYSGVELEQTVAVIVTPKPLNIEAEDKSKVYGDEDPQLTYEITVEELVGMDVISGSLIRVAGEDVGSYKIQQGDLTAGANYTITFIEAELIITPKTLTVTAHDKSKVYGEADPQLTYEITVGALLGMDVISGSLIREAGEAVGSYKIQQVDLTAGANYTITFLEAELTITPKTLTVTAHDKSKVYGEADPQLTYEITVGALLGMDVISGSLIREAGEAVGSYKIQQGDLTAGANYSITFTEAELTITPKTLTITVDDKSKVYGEADPPLTYEITVGALLGMDVISGSLIREAGEDVGSYKIQQGDLTAGANYTITFTEVELIITPKTLTVTAHDKSKVHGKADPDFTVSYDGFVFYDNSNHLDGILAFTREVGEAVGTYTITPSGLTSGNYHIDYVSGVLTITRAAATTGGGGYVPPSPQQKFNGEIYISTIKTVTEEGKQRHTATVSSQAMNNAVKNALKAEISSLNLILEKEQESPADEVQFSLPADILLSLVENNISLKITTSLGVLEIPHNTLLALSRHEVDLKIEMERISEETGEEARQLAREAGGQPLGDSTRIKANITGKTVVTLSLEGVELPVDPAERQSFLDALAVFIYHSDGSTESIVGEIDYDDEGNPVGISIWVDKFSDFVIVKMPQKIILLTVGSEKAQVDGVTTELDAIPFIKQPFNRTLVPVRFVGEILGADVQWLPETKQVLIMYRGREILLTIDSQTVLVDGEEQQLDCPAEIVGNRTFVPLRFVSETLGAQVEWDAATQSITINP